MVKEVSRIGLARRGNSATPVAQRYVSRFAQMAKERGYETVFYTTDDWPGEPAEVAEIVRLPDNGPLGFANALRDAKPYENCDLLLSFERVWDCDFWRSSEGVYPAWLNRRRKTIGGFLRNVLGNLRPRRQQLLKLERELLRPSSKTIVIANSEFVKHEIQEYYEIPSDRIRVVYNGYKPPSLEGDPRTEIRKQLGLKETDVMMLFAGKDWRRKGLKFAIRAAAKLRKRGVKLFVIGKGNRFGLPFGPVKFLGEVEEIARYYEAADLFILPTFYDPFSKACIEAAAHGLPVITSTANGYSEIMLHGEQGEAVERPSDVGGLVKSIERWLDPKRRKVEREKIRSWAQLYRLKETVNATLDVLENPPVTTGVPSGRLT
ncbi:MAG: UDP-glucose:(heptosyl)LPS alpha-1,3-glucosyltransferase [Verrucomicrobiales bacterium]|jgi:UDP-glucose:(heptosyl)LPS alpha-1,3-glucosyltransferase